MKKFINNQSLKISSLVVVGLMSGTQDAMAAKTFNDIGQNIIGGIGTLPSLVTGISYMLGTLLAVLGILKIKDHVENPGQTPLKDGLIRLAVGGALFALPIATEAMSSLLDAGTTSTGAITATVDNIQYN